MNPTGVRCIGVIDVAQRDADQLWFELSNPLGKTACVRQRIEIFDTHLVPGMNGCSDMVQAEGINRIGFLQCICRDQQDLHFVIINDRENKRMDGVSWPAERTDC